MSDSLKVREVALSAEGRIEGLLMGVLSRLNEMNYRMVELHDAIRASQRTASGSVCLELYACGRGCNGCPHPRWVQYNWTKPEDGSAGTMMGINLDAQQREPVLALARTAENYQETVKLVREAKALLLERGKILNAIRTLKYAAKV